MRRGKSKNPNENPGVKPVERIELNERGIPKRIIAGILLLAVGLGFLGYALYNGLSRPAGWTQIEPVSASAESISSELVLLYELGASGLSPTAEYRELSMLYTELCANAYRIFHAQYGFDGVQNPYYLNRHPNEAVTVDPALYAAFEKITAAESRILFAAPYYREYKNLFSDTEDASAALVDPYRNEETAAYFQELSVFTSDPGQIRLELLGENTVRLCVSQEYLSYAAENGVEDFIDFYWTRNAFAVDFIAQALAERGYTYGTVSSYDGFVRTLDRRDTSYSYNLYGYLEDTACAAARMDYKGAISLVSLRTFRVSDRDEVYYRYKNGEKRYPYVDPADGLCKSAMDSMACYSRSDGCAEVLLAMLPIYMEQRSAAQLGAGMYTVSLKGSQILCEDPQITFTDVHPQFTVTKGN